MYGGSGNNQLKWGFLRFMCTEYLQIGVVEFGEHFKHIPIDSFELFCVVGYKTVHFECLFLGYV